MPGLETINESVSHRVSLKKVHHLLQYIMIPKTRVLARRGNVEREMAKGVQRAGHMVRARGTHCTKACMHKSIFHVIEKSTGVIDRVIHIERSDG